MEEHLLRKTQASDVSLCFNRFHGHWYDNRTLSLKHHSNILFFSRCKLASCFHEVHKVARQTFEISLNFHMNGSSVACCKCFISCQRHSTGVDRSLEIRSVLYGSLLRLLLCNIVDYYRDQLPTEEGILLS